jgi:hypothetical protein
MRTPHGEVYAFDPKVDMTPPATKACQSIQWHWIRIIGGQREEARQQMLVVAHGPSAQRGILCDWVFHAPTVPGGAGRAEVQP